MSIWRPYNMLICVTPSEKEQLFQWAHIGRGLGEGGCFFATFFAPKKVRNPFWFFPQKNNPQRSTYACKCLPCQFKTRKIPTPFRSTESMWRFLYISHQQSSLLLFPSSPLGETERGSLLLILILPPILFRHFQKFSKLLYPLRLHGSSI